MIVHRRFLTIGLVAAALLFSQGGGFLIAALCPHLRSETSTCDQVSSRHEPDNHQVSNAGTEHAHHVVPDYHVPEHRIHGGNDALKSQFFADQDKQLTAFGLPSQSCDHCVVHSTPGTFAFSWKESEMPKQTVGGASPTTACQIAPVSNVGVSLLATLAHGPPGESRSKHILINVFRI